jgi:SnoaL-like protein
MGNKISLTEILKINAKFYHAFEVLSIDMMDNLWKHDENVICVHPGWELLVGRLAVRVDILSKLKHCNFLVH